MMELTHLRTFVAVAELQHLTQAAERLHVSQPAASAHIKALEEDLGVALFERRASGLALTATGHALVGYAREVLAASVALRSKAREIAGTVAGKFRLGVRVDPELISLGDLVRVTRQRHPRLELQIHQLNSLNILGGIHSGELDGGFALVGRLPAGIAALDLKHVEYRVVAPAHWHDRVRDADLSGLRKLPWIGAPRGGSHDQMLMSLFGEASLSLNRVVEAAQEAVHATLVEAGVGLALLREDLAFAAQERGKAVVWMGSAARSTLRFVYSDRRAADPAVRAMRELAGELAAAGVEAPGGSCGSPAG
jgi:DNA-binding transcriptional LysR family regulator